MPIIGAIFIILIVSLFGPILSSFFTATIMRETGMTGSSGRRSSCDHCGKRLEWKELIPIVSYVWLRGRCSKCKEPINFRMFVAELIGLVLFFFLGLYTVDLLTNRHLNAELLVELAIQVIAFGFLLYFSIYDLLTFSVPTKIINWFVMYAIGINVLFLLVSITQPGTFGFLSYGSAVNLVSGVLAGLSVYLLIVLTKQKGIGAGDMYLAIVMGLLLGWPGILSAFYVLIFSATGVGLTFAVYKKQFKGLIIPLVPFMAFGYVVAVVYAQEIFNLLFLQL